MSMDKPLVLLVEDDEDFRSRMLQSFGRWYRLVQSPNLKTAALALEAGRYDLVLLDLSFGEDEQLEGLRHIKPFKKVLNETPIIVVTKDQQSSTVVKALRAGADDYVRKDEFDIHSWHTLFDHHIRQNQGKVIDSKPAAVSSDGHVFVGDSPEISRIKDYLIKLSGKPDITVLLLGETGVGKEIAARYLHEHGQRADKPFQAINLTAVSRDLMESSLFGHRKGAFTDAKADQRGAFEKADGGTLFLDEIGEIDHNIQVKLLRFLQDKVITPVGGKEIQLDVQIVAATNRDLKEAMEEGSFRKDLYYRLSTFIVNIPPLRERRRDIELLLNHYLKLNAGEVDILRPEARQQLLQYPWPGNVRELVNAVKTICVHREFEEVDKIDMTLLPEEIREYRFMQDSNSRPTTKAGNLAEQHALADLQAIEEAFTNFSRKSDVANTLDLSLDQLKYKVDKYYREVPDLFGRFPLIRKKYKLNK